MSVGFGAAVVPASDAEAAAWVQERFDRQLVSCVGFEAYLRIGHSSPGDDEPVDASPELVCAIAEMGVRHTSTPDLAHIAVWEGHGWVGTSTYWIEQRPGRGVLVRAAAAIRRRVLQARARRQQLAEQRRLVGQLSAIPSFELPNRRYHLLTGPVSAAAGIRSPADGVEPQMPDLWWPDDRAWFVSTDTDLDFTVVAGSEAFVSELGAAWPGRAARWQGCEGQDGDAEAT